MAENSTLVGRRVFTGQVFISVTVRLEDKGGYIKDAVFFEMTQEFGQGRGVTMQLNLFKLRRLAAALGSAARTRMSLYIEHTESKGLKRQLSLNFKEAKCWLNITCTDGFKAGRELGSYDLLALEASLNSLAQHTEDKLFTQQEAKNL